MILSGVSEQMMNQAINDIASVMPKGQAADMMSFKSLMGKYGFSSYTDMAAFTGMVDKMNKISDSSAKSSVFRALADKYFGGDTTKAARAIADYENKRIQGLISTLQDGGINPDGASIVKGILQAHQNIATMRRLASVGGENIQNTELFKEMNIDAKTAMMMRFAAMKHGKSVEQLTDGELLQTMRAHHGSSISMAEQGGVVTYTLSEGGKTLMTHSEGVWSEQEVQQFAESIKGTDPQSAGRITEFLGNANADQPFSVSVTRSGDGSVSSYSISQGGRSVRESVAEKRDVTQSEIGQKSYQTIQKPMTFELQNGSSITLVSGKISSDGIYQTISGKTREGFGVSFNREESTGDVWNLKVDPNVQLSEDGAYRLATENGGQGMHFIDLSNETIGERFVNNYAQTVGSRMDAKLRESLGGNFTTTFLPKILDSIGLQITSSKTLTQNMVTGSFALAYRSSFNSDGSFNYNKFQERINTLKDIYWGKNRGSSMSFVSTLDTPENVAQRYEKPQMEHFFNEMVADYNQVKNKAESKVESYERQVKNK